ncbi:MAG: class I SAM-dependent methyltransferase [Anaerolineae bacterium]
MELFRGSRLWHRFVAFAFHLLYGPFAWAYDRVSWAVSRGEWRRWQRAVLPRLQGPRVLEIGFGTGDLLVDMAARGYQPWGIDLSPRMVALAARKLRSRGATAHLCRARAQALPFHDAAFDSVATTFPASFINEKETLWEIRRVLRPRGRLIIADGGRLLGRDPLSRFLNWALDVTSGPVEPPAEAQETREGEPDFVIEQEVKRSHPVGLSALSQDVLGRGVSVQEVRYERSTVQVIVARKEGD